MPEKYRCVVCGKEAIGYQGYGCCAAYVCGDHADSILLALAPGETQSNESYYLVRFRNEE